MLNQALDSIVRARASAEARGDIKPYAAAIAFVCAGDLLRRAFLQSLGLKVAFITFYPAAMLAALYGGFRAGVLATLLSAILVDLLWMEPTHSFLLNSPADLVSLAAFVAANIFLSWVVDRLYLATERVRELETSQRADLERQVADRTARLQASEARLNSIIDTAADCIVVLDEWGSIRSVNRATEKTFGYKPQDLIGRRICALMPALRAKDVSALIVFSESEAAKEAMGRRGNGELIPLEVAFAEWRDGDGRRFFTGTLRDLSGRKRTEEGLSRASRLEAVGQLAGGVAHDFNNLLAVIAGNIEIAQSRICDEATQHLLIRAQNACEKGSALNRRLLSLSRKPTLKPVRLNLNDQVEETAKLLVSTLGETITVRTNLASDLWATLADPGEIDSAILNIAANARDAMPMGGRLAISTSNAVLDEAAAAALSGDAKPGEYVCLSITDNGVGMPEEVLGRALEPFFTTKGHGSGTGLGLTSVASFTRQSKGFMTLSSSKGLGCVVSLYLPRCSENISTEAARSALPLGDGELVLVVEDDDQVRDVTLKRLEALGYAVDEARTGLEAVEKLNSGAPIELVLSDVVMPDGMSGYDLADWMATHKPGVKVILSSGYNEERGLGNGQAREPVMLAKPYGREQLARALKDEFARSQRASVASRNCLHHSRLALMGNCET